MIFGAHVIVFSKDAPADRAFLNDVLGFPSVDAGDGWLVFALPPAEVAVHPDEENGRHELFLMTDDVEAEIRSLEQKGVRCSAVHEAVWGWATTFSLPGGGAMSLYQPKLPLAIRREES